MPACVKGGAAAIELSAGDRLHLFEDMERAAGEVFRAWFSGRVPAMPDRGGRADLIWRATVAGSLRAGDPNAVECQIVDDEDHVPAVIDAWAEAFRGAGLSVEIGSVPSGNGHHQYREVRTHVVVFRASSGHERRMNVTVWGAVARGEEQVS